MSVKLSHFCVRDKLYPIFPQQHHSQLFNLYADERCIELAKKIKLLVDDVAVYANFINNNNLKSKLATQLTYLIYKEGYPPQWDHEVFQKVLEQVSNYKSHAKPALHVVKKYEIPEDSGIMMAAEDLRGDDLYTHVHQ